MAQIEITINNWDAYNPKRDQKTYTWLRLENSLGHDPKLFGLSAAQKYVWILILCQCSAANSGTTTLFLEALEHTSQVPVAEIERLLMFLAERQIISVQGELRPDTTAHDRARPDTTAHDREQTCTSKLTTPTNERTNERTNVRTVQTTSRAKPRPRAGPRPNELIAFFCDRWRETRPGDSPYPVTGKDAGQIARVAHDLGEPRTRALIDAYFRMPDAFITKRGHSVAMFVTSLQQIAQFMNSGKVVTQAMAREIEGKVDEAQGQSQLDVVGIIDEFERKRQLKISGGHDAS